MYLGIHSHKAKSNSSSFGVFKYLEKENKHEKEKSLYFSNDYNIHDETKISYDYLHCISAIDNNRNPKRGLNEANFYMLDISPSQRELNHIEEIVEDVLEEKGFDKTIRKEEYALVYNEQKEELTNMLLKDYTKDVMDIYANNFNREIYANQNLLPSNIERGKLDEIINKEYELLLKNNGLGSEKKIYESINKYEILDKEKNIFKIYIPNKFEPNRLYIPSDKFKIEKNILKIEKEYYTEFINKLAEKEKIKKEIVNINEIGNCSKIEKLNEMKFKDAVENEFVVFNTDLKGIDDKHNIYIGIENIEYSNNKCFVNEYKLDDEIYNKNILELNKKHPEIRVQLLAKLLLEKGYSLKENVLTDKKGLAVEESIAKKFHTQLTVSVNKKLASNYNVTKKSEGLFKIKNFDKTELDNFKIKLESEKAIHVETTYKEIELSFWMPKSLSNYGEENNRLSINKELLDNEHQKVILYEPKKSEIEYYDVVSFDKIVNKNKEVYQLTMEVGFGKPILLNIDIDDLDEKQNIPKNLFQKKVNEAIINQGKIVYKKEYEEILKNNSNLNESLKKINRKTEKEFKVFLQRQNLLPKEVKETIAINVNKELKDRLLIETKTAKYDEKITFWVNKKDFSLKNKELTMNADKLNDLIDKAIIRDKEAKVLIPLDFGEAKIEELGKDKKEYLSMDMQINGLTNPITFRYPLSDVKIKDEKYFIENYKFQFTKEKKLQEQIEIEYGERKEEIKEKIWKENGFDAEKRKIIGDDLLYFAKIENERTYKRTNAKDLKTIEHNLKIKAQIDRLRLNKALLHKWKISELETKYIRDKQTREVIFEDIKKGGNNKHVHVVVSRHEKTSLNDKDKISLSPLANQRNNNMPNGSKVGFDRNQFFLDIEKKFDEKFSYDRTFQQSYKYHNHIKNLGKETQQRVINEVIVKEIRKEIVNPIAYLQKEYNPIQKLKAELHIVPIPSSIPKSKIDLLIKLGRILVNSLDKGMKM